MSSGDYPRETGGGCWEGGDVTIYKYPLCLMDVQVIAMPKGARILCVQTQQDTLCLWTIVEPERENVERTIVIVGTGHSIPNPKKLSYIGTAQQGIDMFVWHVFEGGA